jgi:hypothetical protein
MLNLLLSLILVILQFCQFIITVITLALLILGTFAYLTKPSDESFKKFIKHELNKQTKSRIVTHLAKKSFRQRN